VYNLLGQEVATLIDSKQTSGMYQATFNAAGLASGVYLYRLEGNGFVEMKRMMLVK
jgi:hypothetical protein